jgi:GTPase SAR1 family protein
MESNRSASRVTSAVGADRTAARARLRACIERLRARGDVRREGMAAIEEKLASNAFNLVVVGQFKRGKTSFINALIGEPLLPIGVVPLTSIVTLLAYGEHPAFAVRYEDGRTEEITRARLPEFVTERGNPQNLKRVADVAVTYPSPWLKTGVRLIDTPGIGSVYRHNTDVAQRFVPKADAVLFLLSVEQPAGQAELDFLKQAAAHAAKVFLVLNKIDLVTEAELEESVAFTRRALADVLPGNPPIYPLSARRASADAGGEFEAFTAALERFLQHEKDDVLLASIARNLARLIAQARFERELELKALAAPLDELQQKLERFAARKRDVGAAHNEHAVLVEGESRRILRERAEPDLEVFAQELGDEIAAEVERVFEQNRGLPLRALEETLTRHAVERIAQRFDTWRAAEDERIAGAFQEVCARVSARLDAVVDELYRFAADLFALPYEAIRGESLWSAEDRFYYKFWSEPGALYLLTSSALLALPKFLGDKLVLKRAREAAIDAVQVQAGRVRADFQQRLEESARAFAERMAANVEAVLRGLENALTEGAAARSRGAEQADAQRADIEASLARLAQAQAALKDIPGAPDPG